MRSLLLILLWVSLANAADNNIVVVFDTSSSMQSTMSTSHMTRMEVARSALSDTLSQLPYSTNIGVLTFNGWVYEFGTTDKSQMQKAIQSAYPNGGTPLWQYIKMGADKLLEIRKNNNNAGNYKLIVVTDGAAEDAYLALNQNNKIGYLQDIKNRGITIDAIGLDMAGDHPLASQVNGVYMRGDDPQSLKTALEATTTEVSFQDATADTDFQGWEAVPEAFTSAILLGVASFENQPIGEIAKVLATTSNNSNNSVLYFWGCMVVLGLSLFISFLYHILK